MTKRLKNILIGLLSVFAFMFAGIFFVGCCDVDYGKISLVADTGSVELDVGQTAYVTIKIQGYQQGFSNRIRTDARSDGKTNVFSVDNTAYLSDDTIRLTIKGVAGGQGQLVVQTLEADKSCSINVTVNQYASSLSKANTANYVSNKTDFVPDSARFIFDEQTTDKDLTHYYIVPEQEVDFSVLQLTSIDTTQHLAYFENRTNANVIYREITPVDRFSLEEENGQNRLYRHYQNEKIEIENWVGQFYILSVYNHSFVPNEEGIATNILSCLSPIYVLPDLDFNVSGGYLVDGNVAEFVGVPSKIQIVPNNSKKREYILKIEMNENELDSEFSQIVFSLSKSNNYSVVDYYNFSDEDEKGVRYIKISQNSQKKASTEFSMEVYYDIAQDVEDESVRTRLDYTIDILIAPSTIYVNGTTDPQKMTLYNYYLSPEFGWQDLYIDVLSNYSTSPNFDGIYFQFDSSAIDLMINNTTVSNVNSYQPGVTQLYSDLSKPFQIRGKIQPRGTPPIDNKDVKVFVVSDIVEQEGGLAPAEIPYTIIDGARSINPDTTPQPSYYYLDVDAGTQTFNKQIFADKAFSYATARCVGNVNGVEIDTHVENPYVIYKDDDARKDRYYINLSVTPRLTGTFTYTITLDNGISTNISFSCIKTLSTEDPPMRLTSTGNEDVSRWSYSREGNADFDNVLNIEILNTSTKDLITFGSTADIEVTANVSSDGITFAPNDSQYISVSKNSTFYRITTKDNGDTRITFTLTGNVVTNFAPDKRTVTMYIDVSSYSIVQEFYLKNGSDYGLNNTVYYDTTGSNIMANSNSIEFDAVANRPESNNFVQYYFADAFANEIWENGSRDTTAEGDSSYIYEISAIDTNRYINTMIVNDRYNRKFVYFYAYDNLGISKGRIWTTLTITRTENTLSDTRTYQLTIGSGIMFYADSMTVQNGNVRYVINFSNIYNIDYFATFDIANFTYRNAYPSSHETILNANITQRLNEREITRRFDARITTQRYETVKSISLATSMRELNFSSNKLEISLGVYTRPIDATNNSIRAYFTPSGENTYQDMVIISKEYLGNGYYTLNLSCEQFFNKHLGDLLTMPELTGTVYIYPDEWEGRPNFKPLELSVQFRTGSLQNPYLLETADDVLEINASETMLKSHYEIKSQIDMSSVINATPIGIIDGKLVGFSGTITGTTSEAGIINLSINSNNFVATLNGITYAGLFAQINTTDTNEVGVLRNFTVSGTFDLSLTDNARAYVALVTAINQGKLVNVMAEISRKSQINAAGGTIYFGANAALNYGRITQDIKTFETPTDENGDKNRFYELQSKNLAYFYDTLTINANTVYAGGVAGASSGVIERISPESESYKLYGYSGYSAYTLLDVTGNDVSVGGIVGFMAYSQAAGDVIPTVTNQQSIDDLNKWDKDNKNRNYVAAVVDNILVGGEVNVTGENSTAGGIVGTSFIYESDNANYIWESTDRTFIRGEIVGAIVGKEERRQNSSGPTTYISNNKIEAVDENWNAFENAMIIKYSSEVDELPLVPQKEDFADDEAGYEKALTAYYKQIAEYVAIGERFEGERTLDVTADSYLDRALLTENTTQIIPSATSTSNYFGDYFVASANGGTYNILNHAEFQHKDVSVENIVDGTKNSFKMDIENPSENPNAPDMYFMYHFSVSGSVDGSVGKQAQDVIDNAKLNTFSPQTSLYPFSLTSQEVSIVASSSTVLSIDINGNITTKTTGDAVITLSSILNKSKNKIIRIHVFNYFNKNAKEAMFYDSQDISSSNWLRGQTNLPIVGNSYSTIYLVPSYEYTPDENEPAERRFSITYDGILRYANVDYYLDPNLDVTVDVQQKEDNEKDAEENPTTNDFFGTAVTSQTVIFWRIKNPDKNGYGYVLTPEISVRIKNGLDSFYTYTYRMGDATLNVNINYMDAATYIKAKYNKNSITTNKVYTDCVTVKSSNENEFLFYQVFKKDGENSELIQNRLPTSLANITSEEDWKEYIEYVNAEEIDKLINGPDARLFDIKIEKEKVDDNGNQQFKYTLKVNKQSDLFVKRFQANAQNIYGDYILKFFTNEGGAGLFDEVVIELKETVLTYVSVNNYSDGVNATKIDEIAVPSQKGMLEVNLDPIEATFSTFKISNNAVNNQNGSANATFALLYRTRTTYIEVPNFGRMLDGTFSFTYEEFTTFLNSLQANDTDNEIYPYLGKIYLSYYIPSVNVEDGSRVVFDVEVGRGDLDPLSYAVALQIKLLNYATIYFNDKQPIGNDYYVARGLGYDLTLDYYGYSLSEISVSADSNYVTLTNNNDGTYRLNVTNSNVIYNKNEPGYKVTLTVSARRVIDNQEFTSQREVTLYIMDYVLNYSYQEGVNEDIVNGMENGVISTAIGNPYKLEFNILDFIEYFDNPNNVDVINRVNTFVEDMTNSVQWMVYERGKEPFELIRGQTRPVSDYYFFDINEFTVTPSRLYNAASGIYYFSAGGYYRMSEGAYEVEDTDIDTMRIYTEFSFDVHNQSTQDSPIPVYNLDDFLSMEDGSYYILMDDITLPNSIAETPFTPITTQISGLDGNNKNITFSGTYNFDGIENIGVFSEIAEGSVFKNVSVKLDGSVLFRMNVQTFNIGLLAATNNGIITNCQVIKGVIGGTLSVDTSVVASGSNIAGLVAQNTGHITNSRVSININGNVNMAGFVAVNSGLIASSYFAEATMINRTDRDSTAGFVLNNSGRIYTSYVSGGYQANQIYYGFLNDGKLDLSSNNNPKYLASSYGVSGFVNNNSGNIEDCYTNIMLTGTPYAVGFVYQNGGRIERAFSTSLLNSEQTINFGFAQSNTSEGGDAAIIECFFLQQEKVTDVDGNVTQIGINYNIADNLAWQDGVCEIEPLTVKQFNLLDSENDKASGFENFAVAEGRDINSVWFINSQELDNTTGNESEHFDKAKFVYERLELVAPNIIAKSERVLDHMETITQDGVTFTQYIYNYTTEDECKPLGSEYNPILIEDAETFENYIVQENSASNVNTKFYRLISDIDYSEYPENGKTYNTKFVGYLEGNFMNIRGVVLHSASELHSAGLFAELGDSSRSSLRGTLMNFTFAPRSVNFTNTNAVGALVGKVDGGALININVDLYTNYGNNEDINRYATVQGKNLVGGVVGVAVGDYNINKISSQFGARARQQLISENIFDDEIYDWSRYSFAGSVVGVLSGTGHIYNVETSTRVFVSGAKAGLMFGSIGQNVTAQKISLTLLADDSLNGYNYSGFIAGESKGTVENVEVLGENVDFANVRTIPLMPISFGGFAGIMHGGSIKDFYMNVRQISLTSSTAENGINFVGGVVGIAVGRSVAFEGIKIENTTINAFSQVGGVVGVVGLQGETIDYGADENVPVNATFKDLDISCGLNVYGTRQQFVSIGGIAARLNAFSTATVTVTKPDEDDDQPIKNNVITVDANVRVLVYGTNITVNLGGVIGEDSSGNIQVVEYTDSTIVSTNMIVVNDVTKNLEGYSNTALAVLNGDLNITGAGKGVRTSIVAASNSTFNCSLTYRRWIDNLDASNYSLNVTNYGMAKNDG